MRHSSIGRLTRPVSVQQADCAQAKLDRPSEETFAHPSRLLHLVRPQFQVDAEQQDVAGDIESVDCVRPHRDAGTDS